LAVSKNSSKKKFLMQNTKIYNELIQKMRSFFLEKGFVEVPTQSRTSILAACENPHSVMTFQLDGQVWPLKQTGQMDLEEELLKNPEWPGCFCLTTSYRDEKNPISGRHAKIFPMFEFELKGGFEELKKLENQLLNYLGFGSPVEVKYDEICEEYGGVKILEDEHETRMKNELGKCISLQEFPLRTNPFWNMASRGDGTFNKIDVILYGQETIGSAERSCNPEEMREMFYTIMDGEYASKLFQLFGKERVEKELEDFLSYNFFERSGGGIGMTRLSRAYELLKQEKLELV
jgi:aspartyl/asparaginyl-tRNA synthetase